MNIIYLERQLRSGKTPEDLGGVRIGKGMQRIAYCIGNVVVKKKVEGWNDLKSRPPIARLNKFGVGYVRTYRAGNWTLQEKTVVLFDLMNRPEDYPQFSKEEIKEYVKTWETMYLQINIGVGKCQFLDIHEQNCGVDSRGKLVVFDW